VTFDGEVGNGYSGDIAIDDIKLTQGICPNPYATTTLMPVTTVTFRK